jgi:hypothetical protein
MDMRLYPKVAVEENKDFFKSVDRHMPGMMFCVKTGFSLADTALTRSIAK